MTVTQAFKLNPETKIIGIFEDSQVSATAPATPQAGDIWLDSANTQLFVYYNNSWIGVN